MTPARLNPPLWHHDARTPSPLAKAVGAGALKAGIESGYIKLRTP